MDQRTALYRHFDAAGELLYVGISLCAIGRLAQHRMDKQWYQDIARVEVEWLPDRDTALAAEKLAIQTERPRYNVVHAVFGRAQPVRIVDDFPADLPWPIPAKFAMIAWGWDRNPFAGNGAVAVGYQPYRCNAPRWYENYIYTCGACDSSRDDLTDSQRKLALLSDYFMLTQVYEIDPRVVTQAFLNIREFRDAIAESPLGPNLMEADLPEIAKTDPRPEYRFAHSVHVFPCAAAEAKAA